MSSISLRKSNILPDALSCIAIPHSTVDVESPSLPGSYFLCDTIEPTWLVKVH